MKSSIIKWLNMARIDIKNQGDGNDVKISVKEGEGDVWEALWFSKEDGKGYSLETHSNINKIVLELECVGDGVLLLRLMGIDRRCGDRRLPLWVDYTRLSVDGEIVFQERRSLCHDKSYSFTRKVSDGKKILVEMLWEPHEYKGKELANLITLLYEASRANKIIKELPEYSCKRDYYEKLFRLQVIAHLMQDVDYLTFSELDRNDLIQKIVENVQELRNILSQEDRGALNTLNEILQNILYSLSWLVRNSNDCKWIFSYQFPFFVWNLNYFIRLWLSEHDKECANDKGKYFNTRYGEDFNKNKLIICMHLSDDITVLEQNIECANLIKNSVKKVNLITIADSPSAVEWQRRINNEIKIQMFCPLKEYVLPSFMCNGQYLLILSKGAMASKNLAEIIPYMIQNKNVIYRDNQGISLLSTADESVMYFGGALCRS